MRKGVLAVSMGLALFSHAAGAQYDVGGYRISCPAGLPWDDPRCMRTPVAPPAGPPGGIPQAPTPRGKWLRTWGAVSMDDQTGAIGRAAGEYDRATAVERANASCEEIGGKECKLMLAYMYQCAAVASPVSNGENVAGVIAVVTGASIAAAERGAEKKCVSLNKTSCKAVFSECSAPKFIRY